MEPAADCVKFPEILTEPVPVVAIITVSPAAGTTPPTQVVEEDQVPPAAVLVMVAACIPTANKPSRIENNIFFKIKLLLVLILRRLMPVLNELFDLGSTLSITSLPIIYIILTVKKTKLIYFFDKKTKYIVKIHF
jgi:hypothetical protein